MKLKALATLPTAFLAAVGGTVGLRVFERWADAHSVRFTAPVNLVSYMVMFVLPFVLFVIGIDPQRWEPNYSLGRESKADYRKLFIRAAVYYLGTFIAGYL
jgi:hypothetical protein